MYSVHKLRLIVSIYTADGINLHGWWYQITRLMVSIHTADGIYLHYVQMYQFDVLTCTSK